MGPVTIDLFCSLILTSSVTEMQVYIVYPIFSLNSISPLGCGLSN